MEQHAGVPRLPQSEQVAEHKWHHHLWAYTFAASLVTSVSLAVEEITDTTHVAQPRASAILAGTVAITLLSGRRLARKYLEGISSEESSE